MDVQEIEHGSDRREVRAGFRVSRNFLREVLGEQALLDVESGRLELRAIAKQRVE